MIYFDNAATTYPKPETVYDRIMSAMRENCGNPGRSSHRLSMLAEREVFACRIAAADMFGAQPENVIFTYNATYAINMAIKCAFTSGSILISDIEHNSVKRPAHAVSDNVLIFDSCAGLPDGGERTEAILNSIKHQFSHAASRKAILICTAASNICGITMPIAEIGKFCRDEGIYFIVDGAQAGGIIDLNVERDNIDALCLPGHKGLYGPQGSGMLIFGSDPAKIVTYLPRTFIEGGNGVNSLDIAMPDFPPERFEAGTLAVQNIAGLHAGIDFVNQTKTENLHSHEIALTNRFTKKIREALDKKVKIYAPEHTSGILLFNITGYNSGEVAEYLDKREVCIRSGFHCAPLAHQRLGTSKTGAVRASFGAFNTYDEVDTVVEMLAEMR